VLIVHGIGQERAGYAAPLVAGVERTMRIALERLRAAPASGQPLLRHEEALWDRYMERPQHALEQALRTNIPPVVFSGPVGAILQAVVGSWLLRLRARLVPFVGDVIAYQRPDAQRMIRGELEAALQRLAQQSTAAETPRPLTVIAHSLGTVIASDFLWDTRQHPEPFRLSNFFTMGSPMALYALKYGSGHVEEFDQPIRIEPPGCWVNLYHPSDPVATPLRRLNRGYAAAVLQDADIRNRSTFAAHTSYWQDARVHEIIGHKLALDWLEEAGTPPDRVEALRARYAHRLSIV
jgi:hypothetical protein